MNTLSPRQIVQKARPTISSVIEEVAAKVESSLAQTIIQALLAQGDAVSVNAIAAALEQGDVAKVLQLLDLPDALMPIVHGMQDAVYAGGASVAANLRGVSFVFDRLNPRLLHWLQTYPLNLIRQINGTTKEAVRTQLLAGMQAGKNPKAVAVQVKQIIGLTERQAQAVANFRKDLETFHLKRAAEAWNLGGKIDRVNGTQVFKPGEDGLPLDGIFQRRLRDFRYDGQLKSALETGKPLSEAQINKMVKAYHRKFLAYRSRNIARTEAIRATNVGVQDAWIQMIDKGVMPEELVRKQWIVSRDERLCEICAPIPKMNPKRGVKMGESFQTPNGPQSLPPIHPSCRCTIYVRQWEPSQLSEG